MSWRPNPIQNTDATGGKLVTENRALNQRRDDDTIKNFSVTLLDIDNLVFDHFNKKINPQVSENDGTIVKVPIIYGSPERWKSIRVDGYLRDKKGKVQIPLIMYKRNTVSRNEALTTLNRYLQYPYIRKYSVKNQYDRFSVINNMFPVHEIYNVTLPDQVVVTYDCIVWTEYVEQMNKIIETVNFTEDDYWGDKDRFKFRAKIENYTHTTELPADGDRMVRSQFSINVFAYLLPETTSDMMNANKLTTQKMLSKRKIIFDFEIDTHLVVDRGETIRHHSNLPTTCEGTQGSSGTSNSKLTFADVISFLSINKTKIGSWVSSDDGSGNSVIKFSNTQLIPTPNALLGSIDESDKFGVYINGQHIIKTDITSFQQSGSDFIIKINNLADGFSVDSTDEVIAIGKFE